MSMVEERCIWWPGFGEGGPIYRDESMLLAGPVAVSLKPLSLGGPSTGHARTGAPKGSFERLEVVHTPLTWSSKPFSPPLALYQNSDILIEHQDMNGRQPFYHRNTDVDEISCQVAGVRQLITDIGSVDLDPGDFVKIPVGVAHDNWGREDIHLLFYVRAPVELAALPVRFSTPHEFRDWQPGIVPERISTLSGPLNVMVDERLLLSGAAGDGRRLEVAHCNSTRAANSNDRGEPVDICVYRSSELWLGQTHLSMDAGRRYRRNLNFDEVQMQLSGKRTALTEIGSVDLEPGDWLRIPAGIAHASMCVQSTHLTLRASQPLKRLANATREAAMRPLFEIESLRALLGLGPA